MHPMVTGPTYPQGSRKQSTTFYPTMQQNASLKRLIFLKNHQSTSSKWSYNHPRQYPKESINEVSVKNPLATAPHPTPPRARLQARAMRRAAQGGAVC
jgi:hypothetical protein